MTKMKDIISEEDALKKQEDECLLCATHEEAYKKIEDGVACPYCNKNNKYYFEKDDMCVVGQTNGYEPEDEIRKLFVFRCVECNEHIALFPEKISYNANHDIYYTGGANYLVGGDDEDKIFIEAQKGIEKSISNWTERYKKGEDLKEWNLALWIKRDVTRAISEYLFKNGLKK